MWEIIQLMFFIYLGVLSVLDIQTGKLPVWLLTAGGICVILYQFVQREIPWELCLAEAAVGGSFLIVSKVTQGNFGYGESLLILLLGVGVGFWNHRKERRYGRCAMISNVFINNSESVISMTKNARAKAVSIGKTAAVVCMVELDAVRNMERMENHEEGEN